MDAFVPPTVLDRLLLADEDAALRWILWLEDFLGADELRAQIGHVRATWGRTTELDLEVIDAAPAPVQDGVSPSRPSSWARTRSRKASSPCGSSGVTSPA